MTEPRNTFKVKIPANGHGGSIEMNGEPLRNVQAISLSADMKGLTTVEVRFTACEVAWEADEMVWVNVTDLTDTNKRYVRIPSDEYTEAWLEGADMGQLVLDRRDGDDPSTWPCLEP